MSETLVHYHCSGITWPDGRLPSGRRFALAVCDPINSGMKPRTTTNWDRLLKALDAEYSIPNAVASTVKKVGKTYDTNNHEHVFTLEYRVRVLPELNYRSVSAESLLSSVLSG